MTQEHLTTPPPELVQQWINEDDDLTEWHVATQAARWGADMELDACCSWVEVYAECGGSLRAARRPKPSSLKEQALKALNEMNAPLGDVTASRCDTIRRALEALPD